MDTTFMSIIKTSDPHITQSFELNKLKKKW